MLGGVVDDHLVDVRVQEVADDLQRHVGLAVEQRRRAHLLGPLLQGRPQPAEGGVVAGDVVRRGPGRGGADDEPALQRELPADAAQPAALVVEQLAADPDPVAVGHVHHEPPGQRELHGQAAPLGAHGVLGGLHQDLIALLQQLRDLAPVLGHADRDDLVDVEEPALLQADVDERRLHTREDVAHAALPHVPDDGPLPASLDVHLRRTAVLQNGHPGLPRVDGDEDLRLQLSSSGGLGSSVLRRSARAPTPLVTPKAMPARTATAASGTAREKSRAVWRQTGPARAMPAA